MRRIEAETSRSRKRRRAAGAFDEEPVHLRRQPDQAAERSASVGLALRRRAVDAHDAALAAVAVARGRCRSGPSRRGVATVADRQRRQPRRRRCAIDLAELGAAQAAAGREERHRLERLVLPAPFGPVSTTGRSRRRAAARA